MEINQSKLDRQILAGNKWRDNEGIGTFAHTMRFGKTYEAILIIKRILNKAPNATARIIVANEVIKNNWNKYITREELDKSVVVYSIHQVLNNEIKEQCTVLIFDEVHKYLTPLRLPVLQGNFILSKFKLGLTGTPPSGNDGKLLKTYCPIIDVITEREALDNGWVNEYVEYNYKLEFTEEDKLRYIKLSTPISKVINLFKDAHRLFPIPNRNKEFVFRDDYDLIQSCIRGKKYPHGYIPAELIREKLAKLKGWTNDLVLDFDYNIRLNNNWSPVAIEENVKGFDDYVRLRTDLISNNLVKLEAVLRIFKKFPVSTICFNESIDFAEAINEQINKHFNHSSVCYHSKITSRLLIDWNTGEYRTTKDGRPKVFGIKSLKDDVINGCIEGRYKFISTAKALDEGLDIPNLNQVITTAGSTNPIQYSQRNARAKTVDIYDPNKVARIINLYFDDFLHPETGETIISRDKSKLLARQQFNNNEIVYVDNLDDIS